MSDVTIHCRDNGPFLIEGSIEILDAEGNAFEVNPDKPAIALCRCGLSERKPFCDGKHKGSFESCEKASATT